MIRSGITEEEEILNKDFLKGKDLSNQTDYGRPSLPYGLSDRTCDITFMQIDCDSFSYRPDPTNNTEKAVIRLFGVTQEGNSVAAYVHNFTAYFYAQTASDCVFSDLELLKFQEMLNGNEQPAPVLKIEKCQKFTIQNYQEKPQTFLKIYVQNPKFIANLRSRIENGGANKIHSSHKHCCLSETTYESNVLYALRFMIDNEIGGMTWVKVNKKCWEIRPKEKKETHCQIEFDVYDYNNVECLPCEGQYSKIAPLRILSFDIECAAQAGKFPTPSCDPVIQIANIVKIHGQEDIFVRNVFTLQTCAPIVGSKVISCAKETDLLTKWRDFVIAVDPDIITGYNIVNFDFPYIIDRANHLKMERFPYFSKLSKTLSKVKSTTLSSKALGIRDSKDINIEGRIQFDMLQIILREHKLRSYSLNSVSAYFLGEQKEDVHYSVISELQEKDEFSRRRLAIYCIKDAYLPLRLMEKLMCLFNLTEMARVTGVPITFLFTRGQQIKVASQLYRKARNHNLLIPVERKRENEGQYEGAVVIEPTRGFYKEPIATLDFASLYPSIMMAHNLCYSTLVPKNQKNQFNPEDITETPNGDIFVKAHLKKGILPMILEELIGARKRAKNELAKSVDPFEKAVLDGRQLALKISANSVYGFTGAQVGQLPCLAISSSVTSFGRIMIEKTKSIVEEQFTKKHGYEFDAKVIYGDTDSVMVKFGTDDIAKAMELGKEAAAFVSKLFISPIKLEFEKVYCPYLLMNKKRYAGLYWTKPDKYDKMDCKGIETVRRDSCSLVKIIVQEALDQLLILKDPDAAINYCKGMISDLLQNRIDLSLLVITKGLGQRMEGDKNGKYANKQAHVELAQKMRERDEASAPSVGDRVAYVMIKGAHGSKNYEKSEDPLYVLQNNLPIDYMFYLNNQIKLPLIRLFEPILKNAEQTLFSGDHTRNIYVPPKGQQAQGIFKFAVVQRSCLGCKNLLKATQEVVCDTCENRMKEIYIERKQELKTYEKQYCDLWVQCQRCQGSLHQDILCQSRDCPIFYRRVKAKKLVEEALDAVSKFADW